MKVTLETYHNVDIYFDTDGEVFGCGIKTDSKTSKSFTAIKTWIREYQKENDTFESFEVIPNPKKNHYSQKQTTIVGMNKEGLFVYIDPITKKKNQISEWNAGNWCVKNDSLDVHLATIAILELERDRISRKIEDQKNQFLSKTKTLKDLMKK